MFDRLKNGRDIGIETIKLLDAAGVWDTLKQARALLKQAGLKGRKIVEPLSDPAVRPGLAEAMVGLAQLFHEHHQGLARGGHITSTYEPPEEEE